MFGTLVNLTQHTPVDVNQLTAEQNYQDALMALTSAAPKTEAELDTVIAMLVQQFNLSARSAAELYAGYRPNVAL